MTNSISSIYLEWYEGVQLQHNTCRGRYIKATVDNLLKASFAFQGFELLPGGIEDTAKRSEQMSHLYAKRENVQLKPTKNNDMLYWNLLLKGRMEIVGGKKLIYRHTTQNGLRIILEPIQAVRSVTIGIWVLTGSRNENKSNNGISHFIEHMLFKGTKKRSAKEIAEAFDSIGGEINAFTSKEYTCYYAKVLDTHKELALEILADMFFESVFDEEEMEKEKKVVLEEIKMDEETPDDIVHDLLSVATYGDHPLGYSILGTEETLNSFTPEDLREYIKERYTPGNVVVSIAGNTSEEFMVEVEKKFDYSFSESQTKNFYTAPAFLNNRLERRKETEQAHLCIGYEGLGINDEDLYSIILVNNILGGSMSSRLFQEVREERGLAYSVYSYHSSFLDNGLLTIYAGTSVDQLDFLKETIASTTDKFFTEGLTEKELINNKEQLKGNLVLSLESTNSRMSRNARNELLLNNHRSLDEMIEEIDKISIQSTDRIMKRMSRTPFSSALISPH